MATTCNFKECFMRPVSRRPVSKHASARKFRGNIRRTKSANVRMPMRGGWRM